MRRFQWIAEFEESCRDLSLPERKTAQSAGYDLASARDLTVPAGTTVLVPTGLKVYMEAQEVLLIVVRSSLAVKNALVLANQVGVIDADYVDNPDNEGHIMVPLKNTADHTVDIARGQRIAQAIFVRYLLTDDDDTRGTRTGGFGSTDS